MFEDTHEQLTHVSLVWNLISLDKPPQTLHLSHILYLSLPKVCQKILYPLLTVGQG